MKIELRTLMVYIIITLIISAMIITGCQPQGYADQPLSQTLPSSAESIYYYRDADARVERFRNDGLVVIRWTDPDNGTICYINGKNLVCFDGE